jgi:hypothetical protein
VALVSDALDLNVYCVRWSATDAVLVEARSAFEAMRLVDTWLAPRGKAHTALLASDAELRRLKWLPDDARGAAGEVVADSLDYREATRRIEEILANGAWKKSIAEIRAPLAGHIPDGWFGRIKKDLGIEHRWNGPNGVGSRGRGSWVEWRLPPK